MITPRRYWFVGFAQNIITNGIANTERPQMQPESTAPTPSPSSPLDQEAMKYNDMLSFCSKDFSRMSVTVPILIGDWLYATDGMICVRSKGVKLPEGFGKVPPKGMSAWPEPSESIFKALTRFFEVETKEYQKILFFPEQHPRVACAACDETGIFGCEACDHENDCPACFGDGYTQEDVHLDLGGVYVSANLLGRIKHLPQLEIALTPQNHLAGQRFRFRGGEGIIMSQKHVPEKVEYVPFDLFNPPAPTPQPGADPGQPAADRFIHGFAYALANLVRLHGDATEARDLWKESGYKRKDFETAGVDEYDMETLRGLEWLK